MKTNHFMVAAVLLFGTTSCNHYYRMTSRIESDGSMYREVYAKGDSAFLSGNQAHNPFLFEIDTVWKIEKMDSVVNFNFWGDKSELNVKVCRNIPAVDGVYFSIPKAEAYMRPLAVPHEQMKKHFRWFYTYYTYTATYSKIPYIGPVPIDNYLSKEEQNTWFRGNDAVYNGLTGMELNGLLNNIEEKFGAWYNRNLYEINVEVIRHFVSKQGKIDFVRQLTRDKEDVYKRYLSGKGSNFEDIKMEDICRLFDQVGRTNYYSQLYKQNTQAMTKMGDQKIEAARLFFHTIQFEMTLPGRLLSSNARAMNKNTAIWKVDGFHLITDNYVLMAESRTINYWAFGITLLLLLVAPIVYWRKYR